MSVHYTEGVRMRFLWATLMLVFISADQVWAQDLGNSTINLDQIQGSRLWNFSGTLATETQQYSTPIDDRKEFSASNLASLNFNLERKSENSQIQIESQLIKSLNLNYQFISIGQAYAGSSNNEDGFFVGRKKENWSVVDQDWNLGLWQPLYQEDGLRIHQQGLFGGFYKSNFGSTRIQAFASPVFIPSLNGDLSQEVDTLATQSRWMRDLPQQATVNGRDVELSYRLKTPPYTELLAQPSLGLQASWGQADQGTWIALGVARKPMNALSIKYDAALVSRSVGFQGQAEVVPVVHNHNLISADFGFTAQDIDFTLSAMADEPMIEPVQNGFSDEGFQTDYYQQRPLASQTFAAKASSQFLVGSLNQAIQWTVSYLKVNSERTLDYDSEGIQQSQFVPDRFILTNALSLQGQTNLFEKIQVRLKFLRDFDQSGSFWSFRTTYTPTAVWSFFAGFDILGVDQVNEIETDSRFLNSFRHNDRVFGGLNYGF